MLQRCAFCNTEINRDRFMDVREGVLNAYQIKKLYEFFEKDIAGLLLLPATSVHQQQIFDGIYNQLKGLREGEPYIPALMQAAFNINSLKDYLVIKKDPKFLY